MVCLPDGDCLLACQRGRFLAYEHYLLLIMIRQCLSIISWAANNKEWYSLGYTTL